MYEGLSDSTRVHPQALMGTEIKHLVKLITSMRDDAQGGRRVAPYDRAHPPPEVSLHLFSFYSLENEPVYFSLIYRLFLQQSLQRMISKVLIVEHSPGDMLSDNNQSDDDQVTEDSYEGEDDDDEDSDDGEEAESSPSEDVVKEVCSKRTLDPCARAPSVQVPSAPVLTAQNPKHARVKSAEPAGKAPKLMKQSAKKESSMPRKAVVLPGIKMNVPVTST